MLLADEINAAYFQVRFTRTPPVSAYPARFIAGSPHGPCFVRNIVRLVRRRTVGRARAGRPPAQKPGGGAPPPPLQIPGNPPPEKASARRAGREERHLRGFYPRASRLSRSPVRFMA